MGPPDHVEVIRRQSVIIAQLRRHRDNYATAAATLSALLVIGLFYATWRWAR